MKKKKWSLSVENGLGSLILYFHNLNFFMPHPEWKLFVERGLDEVSAYDKYQYLSLYSGGLGSQWLLGLLTDKLPLAAQSRTGSKNVSQRLKDHVSAETDVDLVQGLAGIGVGLAQNPISDCSLEFVVRRIFKLLVKSELGGSFWPMVKRRGRRIRRDIAPRADLGLAHGTPGVLTFLSFLRSADLADFSALRLSHMERVVDYLKAVDLRQQTRRYKNFGFFSDDPVSARGRAAWCYGDPGVGFSLVAAGQAFHRKDWEAYGVAIALRGLDLKPSAGLIRLPYFCHGSVGLAHISARLFQMTNHKLFKERADFWYRYSIAQYRKKPEHTMGLTGLHMHPLGLFHAWISGSIKVDPAWDSLFLLSAPGAKF
ncbi:MAG: hypothetical protein KDD38_11380, partial [Bdellovibrionales bacterium]|nr:hypothetical protein [Bdellovibrionales bacterium]